MSDDIWSKAIKAHREGDFQTAERLYNQVLQMVKDNENVEEQRIVLEHLARLALDCNDNHVALRRYKMLLKLQETSGDNQEISKTCRQISKIYERRKEVLEAIRWAEKAFEAAEAVWNRQQMASSYHLLGIMYQLAKMENKSISALRKAQGIWEELSDDFGLYNSTMVLADIFEDQGNISFCIKELRKCLRFLTGEQDIEDIARLHFRIAQLYLTLNDQRNALIHLLGSFGRSYRLKAPTIQTEAEMIQKIRITQGEEQFWAIVAPRVRKEGEARLRKMLDEFFPPATQEVVEATSEGNEPLTVELPKPIVEIVDEPEPDTTPDEVVSEEYSHTQEVFKQPEEKPIAAPESVVVSYEESEDVERTENSLFVEEAPDPLIVSELTASRIKLAKDDVNRHFYMHFVASLGGVFLALMIAKLMIALF